ncbi:MAG TPA: carboxypeptidase-like regulatory domain-containing protein [Pyrinomonadaceae bacterium]
MKSQKGPITLSVLLVLAFLSLSITLTASSSSAPPQKRPAVLTARVTDENNAPITAARISVFQGEQHLGQMDTNARGIAQLEINLNTGNALELFLEVSKPGMQTKQHKMKLGADFPQRLPIEDITLKPGLPGGGGDKFLLTVKAVDAEGKGIKQAHVNIYVGSYTFGTDSFVRPPTFQEDTNADGMWVFEIPVKPGQKNFEITVEVSREDMQTARRTVTIRPNLIPLSQMEEFELTPRAQASSGFAKADIKVTVTDVDGPLLEGALVKITDGTEWVPSIRSTPHQSHTNTNGSATIAVELLSTRQDVGFDLIVSKPGYKDFKKVVRIDNRWNRAVGTTTEEVIWLDQAPAGTGAIEVKVTVLDSETNSGVAEADVILEGAEYKTATTDTSGVVTLSVKEKGSYVVRLSQDNYWPAKDKEIYVPATGAEESFRLIRKPTKDAAGDTIEVTVLAQEHADTKDKPRPLKNAAVSDGRQTTYTDAQGQATLKGAYAIDQAVTVTADNYEPSTQRVRINKPMFSAATGRATFTLLPGLNENTPIRLIVEVVDHRRKPVQGADVDFYSNGQLLYGGATGANGERDFRSSDTNVPLAELRKGISINVKIGGKEVIVNRQLPANLLEPSIVAGRYQAILERDWTALGRALDQLEGLIAALNNDVRTRKANEAALKQLADDARKAEETAAALLKEVEGFSSSLGGVNGMSTATMQCQSASNKIKGYRNEAETKEQSLRTKLDAALTLAASCNTQAMADGVSKLYRDATALARDMNDLERNASAELRRYLTERTSTTTEITTATTKLDQLRDLANKTRQYTVAADLMLWKTDIVTRRNKYSAELEGLKRQYGLAEYDDDLPTAMSKQIERMTVAVGQSNNVFFLDPDDGSKKAVQMSVANVEASKAQAERLLASFQATATCTSESMETDIQAIQAINSGNVIELGAAALDKKAEACIQKSKQSNQATACRIKIDEALFLMENGGPETAAGKIAEARNLGCEMGKIDEQLDYWKTIRDGVVYLNGLESQCRYKDAVDVIEQIPASIRAKPLMADQIERIRKGADAQAKVVTAESELLQNGRSATVDQSITQAETAARPIACLRDRVRRLRDIYNSKIRDIISTPTTAANGGKLDWRPQMDTAKGRQCNASEAALFARMVGTWRTVMGPKIEIGGSCDNVTGTEYYTDYCENPEATHNKNLARHQTSFKGSVRGTFLRVTWSNGPRKGSGDCSIGNDGVLQCSGLPCRVSGKKSP